MLLSCFVEMNLKSKASSSKSHIKLFSHSPLCFFIFSESISSFSRKIEGRYNLPLASEMITYTHPRRPESNYIWSCMVARPEVAG